MLKRILVCAAFGCWCFLNTWVELAEGGGVHYARFAPLRSVIPSVLCLQAAVTASALAVWQLSRRYRTCAAAAGWLLPVACFPAFGIGAVAALRALPIDASTYLRSRLFLPSAVIVCLAAGTAYCLRPKLGGRVLGVLFLYSWPVLALTIAQAWNVSLRIPEAEFHDRPTAAAITGPDPSIRVVWILFDELSEEIAFERRPKSLCLPHLDRLRAESFFATSAASPSTQTETSLPALTIGADVKAVEHRGVSDLRLWIEGRQEPADWSTVPNVFDDARRLHLNTALVGWFHPYGRVLARSLTRCFWTAAWQLTGAEEPTEPRTLWESIRDRALLHSAVLPLLGHLPGAHPDAYHRAAKIERYQYLERHARESAADPSIGLLLIHLPTPHSPGIYDRAKRQYTATTPSDYFDGVALADRTLGALREAMERAGVWEKTAVLVSSDHGWRIHLRRGGSNWSAEEEEAAAAGATGGSPFLLKLPARSEMVRYSAHFDTVITRELIGRILTGELRDPARIAATIEAASRNIDLTRPELSSSNRPDRHTSP